jgi:pimeloyl-ACP methyl ester carboxylesterase
MGGGTIIKFSETNRERINKIVLVEPSVLHQEVPQLGKIALLPGVGEFLYSINSNFMRKFTLKNTFIHNMNHITEAYFDQLTRFQKVRGTTENLLKILRKGFFYTLEEEVHQLGKFNLPNLVVGGRQTKGILLEKTEEVHRILTGSDLEILDQAGHCPNIDQPEKFNQLVLAFLTG